MDPAALAAERRVALVIGNGAYRHEAALPNPANDARAVATALRRLGFEVTEGIDLDRGGMEEALLAFARAAQDADDALAFYAGHGIQVNGQNYLLPVDTKLEDERDLRRYPTADQITADAAGARRVALVILDACRDNPFARSLARQMGTRSLEVSQGLAAPAFTPANTLIAYATAADAVAVDAVVAGGEITTHSPFTAALLRHLEEPGLEVRLLFGKVRDAVFEATRGRQVPFTYGSLGGEAIFLAPAAPDPRAIEAMLTAVERREIQNSLHRLGYYDGPSGTVMSYEVREAIRRFQISIGAPGTGFLSPGQMVELHRLALPLLAPFEVSHRAELSELAAKSEAGDRQAQLLLGVYYDTWYEDAGVPKDNAEAARWYRRAAEAGHAVAARNLGWMLKDGDGIEQDHAEALGWLRMAAEAGLPEAQYAMGEMYAEGWGTLPDKAEAVRWFIRASAQEQSGMAGLARAYLRALSAWHEESRPSQAGVSRTE